MLLEYSLHSTGEKWLLGFFLFFFLLLNLNSRPPFTLNDTQPFFWPTSSPFFQQCIAANKSNDRPQSASISLKSTTNSPNKTRTNSLLQKVSLPAQILLPSVQLDPGSKEYFLKINEQIIPLDLSAFASYRSIVAPTIDKDYYPEIENISRCFWPENIIDPHLCLLTNNFLPLRKKEILIINRPAFREYLTKLNEIVKKPPRNVRLTLDQDGKVKASVKEQYGYSLDLNKIISQPEQYFQKLQQQKTIALPIKKIAPLLTSKNYQKLGLRQKIGSGSSNFAGSPKNRIHNIHNAANKFANILIAPNEIFSFIKTLGPVNAETGYKEELVIKNHKTIPEFGGGVCQVSTTLFRAAVNTGLKITERRNHAYPVQYYSPQGTDATIYIPKPDLQFLNDTPGYIMLIPSIRGNTLTFDIIGSSDGRQVTTEGPFLVKKTPEGNLKYVWWQIIKKDGKETRQPFWSFYQNAAAFHH